MSRSRTISIQVEPRSMVGSAAARRLRRQGQVPAVLYGRGIETTMVALSGEAVHAVTHHPGMMELVIGAAGDQTSAIVKELQRNPLTGAVEHIDFLAVRADEAIQSVVPLEAHGEPKGSARGGQLEQILHELEIRCLPADLPESIEIEVSGLDLDETMHVADLALPEGIKALSDPNLAVFQVRLPRVDVVAAPTAVEAEGEAAKEEAGDAKEG